MKVSVEGDPEDKSINKCKLLLIFDQYHATKGRIPALEGPKILLMREMWNERKENKLLQGCMCVFACVCLCVCVCLSKYNHE